MEMEMLKIFAYRTVAVVHFTDTESLKPLIVSGVSRSAKLVLPIETQKSHFCMRPWSLLTTLNFSKQGPTDTTVL